MSLLISDFDYPLPPERIAQHPLAERDASRLLLLVDGVISQDSFRNIGRYVEPGSLLVFNDTRVIRARLIFHKPSGAPIEIFCLEPLGPVSEIQAAFRQQGGCSWKCLVGNVKRWKSGDLTMAFEAPDRATGMLLATLDGALDDGCFRVTFRWSPPEKTFSEVLEKAGLVPLPPYIHRKTEEADTTRYQTIFAEHDGSVAAPTAGLHFSKAIMDQLRDNGCEFAKVTLHVGVGTFRPVTTPAIEEHVMHAEKIVVSLETLDQLIGNAGRAVIAVGTTSARTLESLYWTGLRLIKNAHSGTPCVGQWDPYRGEFDDRTPALDALQALRDYLVKNELRSFSGETQDRKSVV